MTRRIARMSAALAATTLAVTTLTAAVPVSPAAAAAAGWTSPKAVQPGTSPMLSFSPTGAVALGSRLSRHGRLSGAEIDLATRAGSFAASPYQLSAPNAGHGAEPLTGLALSSDGYLAAAFADAIAPAPVLARVAPPAPSSFSTVQQLIPLGAAAAGQAAPDEFALLATADGEIVGAGTDDAGDLSTATLAAHQTRFSLGRGPGGLSATDAFALAGDPAGNTFLAGDDAAGCTSVAFRPARGHFATTYTTGNCASATPNVFDAITAPTDGTAALLSEDLSESGTVANRLLVQVGHDGRFGAATQLGGALGGPVGLASDADGELTVEWTGCQTGPIVDGQLSTSDCAIDATTGSVSGGFSARAAAGTILAPAAPGSALTALTADRAVAVSRSVGTSCVIDAFTAAPGGGFRPGHRLGRARRLIALRSDSHGDLLAVWTAVNGDLDAATASAGNGRWSGTHRLSATPVSAADVSVVYGPRGRAIVAWSRGDTTYAASYASR